MTSLTWRKLRLYAQLQEYVSEPDELITLLQQAQKAVLSGSFILNLMLPVANLFVVKNLDFVITSRDDMNMLVEYFVRENYISTNRSYESWSSYNVCVQYMNKPDNCFYIRLLFHEGNLPKHVIVMFDFTFLMNYYNGTNIFCAFEQHISSQHGQLVNRQHLLLQRIKKYVDRGFAITINNTFVLERFLNTNIKFKKIRKIVF